MFAELTWATSANMHWKIVCIHVLLQRPEITRFECLSHCLVGGLLPQASLLEVETVVLQVETHHGAVCVEGEGVEGCADDSDPPKAA